MKLVILPGETPNLPNPNQHEDSIASVWVYWKAALVPGGLLAALKQRQREEKKIRRCWNVTQMLLLLHGKAVVSCRERHYTYLGQKGSTHANHRLTELALHSHCSSVRSGAQGKELEICCFLQSKISWGEKKKIGKEEEKICFSHCCYQSQKWI